MNFGELRIESFLEKTHGEVYGKTFFDGKHLYYTRSYTWQTDMNGYLAVSPSDSSSVVRVPPVIDLDESWLVFFGLYCGDGAKGSEDREQPGLLNPNVSFSQYEPNLIKFAVVHFREIFPDARFTFAIGEDSALFMAGEGQEKLRHHYGERIPETPPLSQVRSELSDADRRYLGESRRIQSDPSQDLAFYYYHKSAMESILTEEKRRYLVESDVALTPRDRVAASVRRPYKKGAREPGGSSRSDELHLASIPGIGQLFLKVMEELEISILEDIQNSPQGLVRWRDTPSQLGEELRVKDFFKNSNFGKLGDERPRFDTTKDMFASGKQNLVRGQWPRSKWVDLKATVKINPLWCYASGLYLAEGTTNKSKFFSMYRERPTGLGLGFTSSENRSFAMVLGALGQLLPPESCVAAWKVKVGSQYFPELVVVGLKNAVPMLRGGKTGQGKMRTMEISLAIKDWALALIPAMQQYQQKYSHVEPTGAGLPRLDFWASSSLCKWYFPLVIYTAFGDSVEDPSREFVV